MKDNFLEVVNRQINSQLTGIENKLKEFNSFYSDKEIDEFLDEILFNSEHENEKIEKSSPLISLMDFYEKFIFNYSGSLVDKLNSLLGKKIVTKNNFVDIDEFRTINSAFIKNNLFIPPVLLITILVEYRKHDFFLLLIAHFETKGHTFKKEKKNPKMTTLLKHKFYNLNKNYAYYLKNNTDFKQNPQVEEFHNLSQQFEEYRKKTRMVKDPKLIKAINSKLEENYCLLKIDFKMLMEVQDEIYKHIPELKISRNKILYLMKTFFDLVLLNRKEKYFSVEEFKQKTDNTIVKSKSIEELLKKDYRDYYLGKIKIMLAL